MLTAKQLKDLEAEEICAYNVLLAIDAERWSMASAAEYVAQQRVHEALLDQLFAENRRWWWSAPVRLEAA